MADKQEIPIARYDMIAVTRCGEGWQELQREPEGDWMRYEDHLAAISSLGHQLSQEKELGERLKNANELDRRALWAAVRSIDEEITGRMWLLEGRGSYEWDDDRYRQEFGWAVHALQEKLEPLRKISHDLMNCPDTEKGVDSVRKLESENARLTEALRAAEANADFLRKSVGAAHMMISRDDLKELDSEWDATDLQRLKKYITGLCERLGKPVSDEEALRLLKHYRDAQYHKRCTIGSEPPKFDHRCVICRNTDALLAARRTQEREEAK